VSLLFRKFGSLGVSRYRDSFTERRIVSAKKYVRLSIDGVDAAFPASLRFPVFDMKPQETSRQ
jgi:hypothetical protein